MSETPTCPPVPRRATESGADALSGALVARSDTAPLSGALRDVLHKLRASGAHIARHASEPDRITVQLPERRGEWADYDIKLLRDNKADVLALLCAEEWAERAEALAARWEALQRAVAAAWDRKVRPRDGLHCTCEACSTYRLGGVMVATREHWAIFERYLDVWKAFSTGDARIVSTALDAYEAYGQRYGLERAE